MYLKLKKAVFILFIITTFPILSQSKDRCISGDCQNGKGILMDTDGNKLIGTFLNGKLEGFAEAEFKDGDKFSGIYKNGERNGKGKLVHSDGMIEFEGEFKDGFPHGNGTMYDSEGKISKTGIFKNGYKYFNIPTFDFINKTWVKPEKWLGGSLEKSQVFFIQYLSEPDFLGIETADGSPDFSDPHLEKTYVEAKVNGFLGTIILCIDKKQESEMDKFLTKPMVLIEFDGRIVGYNKGESGINRELIVNVETIRRMGHAVLSSKTN